jgi:hypothetical protein
MIYTDYWRHISAPRTRGVWGLSEVSTRGQQQLVLYLEDLGGIRSRNCIFQTLKQDVFFPHIYFPMCGYLKKKRKNKTKQKKPSVDRYYIITLFKYLRW